MKLNQPSQDITNQSQLPNNSSPVTGVVKVCMESLKGILTPEEQKVCEDSNNHFELLLIQFREEVKIISNRIGYNYETNSYAKKLGVFNNVKDKELKRLLGKGFFNKNKTLKNLFNEIIEKSNIDLETTKNVLMKEGLEDLILENMGEVKEQLETFEIPTNIEHLMIDNPEEIGRMIKEGKYTNLNLYCKSGLIFVFIKNPEAFIKFIKTIGESGIRSLNLKQDNLNLVFMNNPQAFINFIKTAGESGIRSLNLSFNNLSEIFQDNSEFLIDTLNNIEQGNIRYWNLRYNRIAKLLNSNPTLKTQFESKIEELEKKGIIVLYDDD